MDLVIDEIEDIPENQIKKVQFNDATKLYSNHNPINSSTPISSSKISYEDILAKMNMFVHDGKLHLLPSSQKPQQQQSQQQHPQQQPQQQQQQYPKIHVQNQYIYNKYFRYTQQELETEPQVPKTQKEYCEQVLKDMLRREQIKRIKSQKMVIASSDFTKVDQNHIYMNGNYNKLFGFSNR